MRDVEVAGSPPSGSACGGYASWRDSGPMVLGRTDGLDGTHAGGSRAGSERRQANASFAAQGLFSTLAASVAVRQPSWR